MFRCSCCGQFECGCTQKTNEKHAEALELVASCAKDIVEFWPNFSFRQVRTMCSKMDALKEALNLLKDGQ